MIDSQHLNELIYMAKEGGNTSEWSPVSADGRNQLERIGTLYTQVLVKCERIKIRSKHPVEIAIADPLTVALLERLGGDYSIDPNYLTTNDEQAQNPGRILKVGTMRRGLIDLYRDVQSNRDPYILLATGVDEIHDPNHYEFIDVQGLVPPRTGCEICGSSDDVRHITHTKAYCHCQVDMKPEAYMLWLCKECREVLRERKEK